MWFHRSFLFTAVRKNVSGIDVFYPTIQKLSIQLDPDATRTERRQRFIFQIIQLIFRHIKNVVTYVDNLIAAATTHMEMIALLNTVFEECRFHGMKLNLRKCILGVLELTWLGYALNICGISPEYDKAEAIKEMTLPKTIKEVQLLGLIPIFLRTNRKLCPDSSTTQCSH